jgi:hypothetical protein
LPGTNYPGYNIINIYSAKPPSGGTFTANVLTGIAMVTDFVFTIVGVVGENNPLFYKFLYYLDEELY